MKYLIRIILSVILLTSSVAAVNAQVSDDFSDGDFTNNPTWSGDTGEFEIELNQLNSKGVDGGGTSYLSTANSFAGSITWEFLVELGFAPSGSNKVRIYLVSDESDLENSLIGYFIEIGQSGNDQIKFYKQDADNSETLIFTGSSSLSGNITVRIQVIRDCSGSWQISADTSGGTNYVNEGSPFTESTYTSSSYFGFVCYYTSTRKDLFYFDDVSISTGLEISDIAVPGANSIQVEFSEYVEESSAENSANYSIDNGVSIISASREVSNHKIVNLGVSALATNSYNLSIINVADECSSTPLANSVTLNFDYLQLELSELLTVSETELQLTFNDDLDPTSAETVTNYAVDNAIGQPNSVSINPSDSKVVSLTFDNPFQALTNYTLEYGDINNGLMNSEIAAGSTTNFNYVIPLVVESIEVTTKNAVELTFNLELDEASAETPSNYNIDNGIGTPTSATLDPDDLKIVTLALDTDLSQDSYTITLNNIKDAGNNAISPGTTANFDYLPLAIAEVEALGATEIEITFNQALDQTTAQTVENYSLDFEIENITSAVLAPDNSAIVTLTLGTALVNNTYQLTINNVQNLSGNAIAENLEVAVEFITQTNFRNIVINEIFADPTPSQGLPDSEFVELSNLSDKSIDIGSFDLTGGTIGDFVLGPNKYIILAPASNTAEFEPYGDVIGVSSWNTLSNGGEQILLKDNLGNLVDSLTYYSDWHEEDKEDGGWSLEQINPEVVCNYSGNWASSLASVGGTPGAENSVFDNTPDATGPNLVTVSVVSPDELRLLFDEPMDIASLDVAVYSVSSGTLTILTTSVESSLFSVQLTLDESLESGNTYLINLSNATDCAGNLIEENSVSIDYDIEPPVLERIVISSLNAIELIFDEELKGSVAEDEVNYSMNNGIGTPESAILDESTNKNVMLVFENYFSSLQENTLTISNLEDLKENVLSISIESSFTYDQSIDTVVVKSANQIDITYNRRVDESAATKLANYFVDNDAGNPKLVYVDQDNDLVFHLIFENELDDNKELTLSTINILDEEGNYLPTPEYNFTYDTRGPKVNDVLVLDDHSLAVMFDEKVDQFSAESIENYVFDEVYSNSRTLQANDSTVLLEFEQRFEREVTYELSIDNVKDIFSNEMSSKVNKEFIYDTFPPQLDSILVKSPSELVLLFNEVLDAVSANSATNYELGNDTGNPATATLNRENGNELLLSFSSDFPVDSDIAITISSITDIRGNILESIIESSFNTTAFYISSLEAISSAEVQIVFNKLPDLTAALNSSNYNISEAVISNVETVDSQSRTFSLTLDEGMEDNSMHYLENKPYRRVGKCGSHK